MNRYHTYQQNIKYKDYDKKLEKLEKYRLLVLSILNLKGVEKLNFASVAKKLRMDKSDVQRIWRANRFSEQVNLTITPIIKRKK